MNPLLIAPALSIVKELIKFGGSFRKEAIGATIVPSVVSVYNTMQEACVDGCTFGDAIFAVSGLQWATLLTSIIALVVHLNAKAIASQAGE